MAIDYEWVDGKEVTSDLIRECSELYSRCYGLWGSSSRMPGKHVRLSPSRLSAWFDMGNTELCYARDGDRLIGYAIASRITVTGYKPIEWVTQFVVDEAYRNQGVGKTILYAIWGLTNYFAWGIVTSNPYAVRALERVTRRRCVPVEISREIDLIRKAGAMGIPYIGGDTEFVITEDRSAVNTHFFAQHDDLAEKLGNVTRDSAEWCLGELEEGWEWVAFTFERQGPMPFSKEEVAELVRRSDGVARQAYARMSPNVTSHAWTRYSAYEADMAIKWLGLSEGKSVLDLGCGVGRHSIELARRGLCVSGIDYVEENVREARVAAGGMGNCTFECSDLLEYVCSESYDAALCLYDVVGSYVDDFKNEILLSKLFGSLRAGGRALVSVMNYSLVESTAHQKFSFERDPSAVLHLQSSETMYQTGNVFDPRYCLVDTETHVVYRREQFSRGSGLPIELLVRDRRFTSEEIERMCWEAGFKVLFVRCVRAGDWESKLAADDEHAKEILLLLERPC